ncbi:DUF5412 family protein [Sporosarcina limicola]|uniref:Uncharacterized protein n=1 Tax=Sporosarcina limicola TaxID=34101 RepID=A0A927RFJ4_9BACL|nr:DUF5412 family protein [Sporosarcina limicola]MBE1555572.1 hypothetical protein [Sporosarcina limicola]
MNLYLNLFVLLTLLITILLLFIFCVALCIYFIKKKQFPQKQLVASLTSAIVFSRLFVYMNYFFTFDNLEGEFYIGPVNSPTEQYTANAYYMTYGGAAGGVNLWVEITAIDEKDKIETVYYSGGPSSVAFQKQRYSKC